jgi:hypothetical protein
MGRPCTGGARTKKKSNQCVGITKKKGATNRLKTHKTQPCCWIHTKYSKRGDDSGNSSECAVTPDFSRFYSLLKPDQAVGLRVKPSGLGKKSGNGLFVDMPQKWKRETPNKPVFESGDIICEYTGKLLTTAELNQKYPGSSRGAYVVPIRYKVGKKWYHRYIDAAKPHKSGVARYANHCRDADKQAKKCKGNNARFASENNGHNPFIFLEATKNIRDGDEIFADYGERYWG